MLTQDVVGTTRVQRKVQRSILGATPRSTPGATIGSTRFNPRCDILVRAKALNQSCTLVKPRARGSSRSPGGYNTRPPWGRGVFHRALPFGGVS